EAASSAPANAKAGVHQPLTVCSWRKIATTAPIEPPAETPMIPGSASGLRNSPCIAAPLAASAKPTSPATSSRGRRTDQLIAAWPGSSSTGRRRLLATMIHRVSQKGSCTTPMAAPSVTLATSKSTSQRVRSGARRGNGRAGRNAAGISRPASPRASTPKALLSLTSGRLRMQVLGPLLDGQDVVVVRGLRMVHRIHPAVLYRRHVLEYGVVQDARHELRPFVGDDDLGRHGDDGLRIDHLPALDAVDGRQVGPARHLDDVV